MVEFWLPDESSGEIVAYTQLDAAAVQGAVARWQTLRGGLHFPPAADSVLAQVAANAILVRVEEAGSDYEYRSVGAALVAGFGEDFSGRRLSDIVATAPRFGIGLRMLYEMVRYSGEPLFYRGWVGADMPGARFVYYESAILPFGPDPVDHILVVSALVPRDGIYPALPQMLRA
jgi:hypothetical protein